MGGVCVHTGRWEGGGRDKCAFGEVGGACVYMGQVHTQEQVRTRGCGRGKWGGGRAGVHTGRGGGGGGGEVWIRGGGQ